MSLQSSVARKIVVYPSNYEDFIIVQEYNSRLKKGEKKDNIKNYSV